MKLEVITTDSVIGDRYARVENRDATHLDWEATYVSFSGFFGSYGPHVFKAAPTMHETLKKLERLVMREGDAEQVAALVAALKSARGE
jgi:hypothetical protein